MTASSRWKTSKLIVASPGMPAVAASNSDFFEDEFCFRELLGEFLAQFLDVVVAGLMDPGDDDPIAAHRGFLKRFEQFHHDLRRAAVEIDQLKAKTDLRIAQSYKKVCHLLQQWPVKGGNILGIGFAGNNELIAD